LVAVSKPAAPDPVFTFVGGLLARIQDNSAICSARVVKDKISAGRGEMLKAFGISCGRKEWKRRVSSWSDGLSGASGLGSSLESPV
jgi:hypothetical protein